MTLSSDQSTQNRIKLAQQLGHIAAVLIKNVLIKQHGSSSFPSVPVSLSMVNIVFASCDD